mmetsp:Transcript_7167/g.21073  ORF Transcript_7167/g.21073 Transcript_7167/m.21073 type:complete len:155 (+) Transcript_7167:204-668(+)
MFLCAAVIGQNSQPLWLQTFQEAASSAVQPSDPLAFHYLVHCALDGVEEKSAVALPRRVPSQGAADCYLGQLYSTEEYTVHGLMTNTQIKLLVVVDQDAPREDALRLVLNRIHVAYVDAISNPFNEPGLPITSARFDQSVKQIIAVANGTAQPV